VVVRGNSNEQPHMNIGLHKFTKKFRFSIFILAALLHPFIAEVTVF